jgi:hypothetical protein
VLEQLVQHLYEKTGVPMPELQTLARSQVSAHVQQLLASGNKIGAIKAYRDEAFARARKRHMGSQNSLSETR